MFNFLRNKKDSAPNVKPFEIGGGNLLIDLPFQYNTKMENNNEGYKTVVFRDPSCSDVILRITVLFFAGPDDSEPPAGVGPDSIIKMAKARGKRLQFAEGKPYFRDIKEDENEININYMVGIEDAAVVISCCAQRQVIRDPIVQTMIEAIEPAIATIRLSPMRTYRVEGDYPIVVNELSLEHFELLNKWRKFANAASRDLVGAAPFLSGSSDLVTLQKILDHPKIDKSDTALLEGLGVVLGDVFARELGLIWVSITDPQGYTPALQYPKSTILLYPKDMLVRRVNKGESICIEFLHDHIIASTKKMILSGKYNRG